MFDFAQKTCHDVGECTSSDTATKILTDSPDKDTVVMPQVEYMSMLHQIEKLQKEQALHEQIITVVSRRVGDLERVCLQHTNFPNQSFSSTARSRTSLRHRYTDPLQYGSRSRSRSRSRHRCTNIEK